MLSVTLVFPALLALVNADFNGDASKVIETASALSSLVAGWDKSVGLSGALAIQQTYDPLSEAVAALESSAESAETNADTVETLDKLASGISALLGALVSKAEDFNAVGASQIVQGDINHLSGPSGSIVSKIYERGKNECELISSLESPLSSLQEAFRSAAEAFDASAPSFPELKCEGSASASSSSSSSRISEPSSDNGSANSSALPFASESAKSSTGVASANGACATGIVVAAAAVAAGGAILL